MAAIKDGGSAFPWTNCETHGLSGGYGMTLRDYFAAKAMQARILLKDNRTRSEIVNDSYHDADAMLKERDK